MKTFSLFLFCLLIAFTGCRQSTIDPGNGGIEPIVDPYADRANTKFFYEGGTLVEVLRPDDLMSTIIVVKFDGTVIYFSKYLNHNGYGYYYKPDKFVKKDKTFLDSLDNICVKYNFANYPDALPLNKDSLVMIWPGCDRTYSWRVNKSSDLKSTWYYTSWHGTPKYPENFAEFLNEISSFLGLEKE